MFFAVVTTWFSVPITAEHCENRVSLVHNQPPSSSAAAVTVPGRLRPYFTSFRCSRSWNLHRQRCLDEVSRRENGIGQLLGTASTADYPSVSVEICSSVVGVVSRPLAAGLRQFDTRRRFIISPVTAAVSDERRRSACLPRQSSCTVTLAALDTKIVLAYLLTYLLTYDIL